MPTKINATAVTGSQVGLDSDPTLLQTARNTVDQLARWHTDNAPATFYPAAARVGYNPATGASAYRRRAAVGA